MVGLGAGDLWWVAISAFVAGMAGALALAIRGGLRRLARKGREGFLEWFGAAIDQHVTPKFDELRVETKHIATVLEQRTLETATVVRSELLAQTEELDSSIKETQGVLRGHIAADEAAMQKAAERLTTGQERLMGKLETDRAEAAQEMTEMREEVHTHIKADAIEFDENRAIVGPLAEAVRRIEQRLDTDRPDQPTTTPENL